MTGCTTGVCGVGGYTGPAPGDPDLDSPILNALAAFGGIDVTWTYPTIRPHAVSHTIVYQAPSSDFDAAVLLTRVSGSSYFDRVTPDVEFFYWIRVVSINGTVGNLIGPVAATASSMAADIIELLTAQIDDSLLAITLKNKLSEISLLNENLLQEIMDRETGAISLAQAIQDAQDGVAQALTFIDTEANSRTTAVSAIAEQLTIVAATLGDDLAAVTTAMQVDIDALNGTVDAMYTAKVQVNGLIGGFGIHNDGASVDAGFDVDTFWVGRTGPDKRKPFIISGGVVYLDAAVIRDASITNAKIGGAITSDNWDGANTGWAIDKSGYANFNNVRVRGDILANSITANTINTGHINVEQATAARYVDSTSHIGSALTVYPVADWQGDITTSAMNTQGAPIMVDFDAKVEDRDDGTSVYVQLLRDAGSLYAGPIEDMPHSFSCDGASHTYTLRFSNMVQLFSRWLKVQAFIR